MILVALLLVALLAAVLILSLGHAGPLNEIERPYVALAPIPLVIAIVVPASIRLTLGYAPALSRWVDLASGVGLLTSAILGVWGVTLVVAAMRRRRAWGWPLGVAVLLAGGPALVIYATTWLLKLMD